MVDVVPSNGVLKPEERLKATGRRWMIHGRKKSRSEMISVFMEEETWLNHHLLLFGKLFGKLSYGVLAMTWRYDWDMMADWVWYRGVEYYHQVVIGDYDSDYRDIYQPTNFCPFYLKASCYSSGLYSTS